MKTQSLLLVENDVAALEELARIMRYLGYQAFQQSTSANEAWTLLNIKTFTCVIANWEMPEMSGLALLRIVRRDDRYTSLPFFLADNVFTKPKVVEAGRAGATGLIVKPYQTEVIRAKIAGLAKAREEQVPAEMRVSFDEAMCMLDGGDYEGALRLFEKLLQERETAEIYYNIGYIKTVQGRYGEAIEAFRKAAQLDRLFAKAYEAMGRCYKEMGRLIDAETCLSKAAEIYLKSEKDEYAEEILNEILTINPETVNVYNSLGVLYRKKGDLQTSLQHYMRALKIHPNEPKIYYNVGRLHVDLKDFERAKHYFGLALGADPNFKEAREALKAVELGML